MNQCIRCRVEQPVEQFSWRWRVLGIRQKVCKTCRKAEVAGWYARHRQAHVQKVRRNTDAQRQELKGITAFELRKKHTPLLKLPSMWTRGFFAATVGTVSAQTIEKFIAAQKGV